MLYMCNTRLDCSVPVLPGGPKVFTSPSLVTGFFLASQGGVYSPLNATPTPSVWNFRNLIRSAQLVLLLELPALKAST